MQIENCPETTNDDPSNEAGFTLVEVLVTLVIISLLIGFTVVSVVPQIAKGKTVRVQGDLASIETALEMYSLDKFNYPSEQEGLASLVENGYIKKLSLDPWGNPYEYRNPGENAVIDIFSLGADGEPGGEDQNADIGNWQ